MFKPEMIDSIPVPNSLDRAAIAALVDDLITARTFVETATSTVHSAIRASGGPAKLRKKLHAWHTLSTSDFLDELASQGIALTVASRVEWSQLFAVQRAKTREAVEQWMTTSRSIDGAIVDAFNLGIEDRKLIAEF